MCIIKSIDWTFFTFNGWTEQKRQIGWSKNNYMNLKWGNNLLSMIFHKFDFLKIPNIFWLSDLNLIFKICSCYESWQFSVQKIKIQKIARPNKIFDPKIFLSTIFLGPSLNVVGQHKMWSKNWNIFGPKLEKIWIQKWMKFNPNKVCVKKDWVQKCWVKICCPKNVCSNSFVLEKIVGQKRFGS